jgi:hypothetical protein
LQKQTLVVEPGKEVVHHSSAVANEVPPPLEHRHHHSHHRNHDVHEGIVRVPLPPVAVTHVDAAVQSSPVIVDERSRTHHLSRTITEVVPGKTVEHQEIRVHEPAVKSVQHHQIKVHEPVKTIQHHQVRVQETVKAPLAPVKQTLVKAVSKSYLSPSEFYRTRTDHHQEKVVVTQTGKEHFVPNYKPSSPYSRCYCV